MSKNIKQMKIELVVEVKDNGELVTKEYKTGFIPFAKLIEVTKQLEGLDKLSEMEAMQETFKVVCDLYSNQFDVDELINGLHAPDATKIIQDNIQFLSTGELPKKEEEEK